MNKLFLAPMAEITHRGFRELIEDFGGCDEYFSEMISAKGVLSGGPFEKYYIDNGPKPEKLVFQLVGAEINSICRAAEYLNSLECAGIDINMGCSAPLIRKTGAGAGWLSSIDNAGKLISAVRPVVKKRLSVKLRIGFKDDFEYLVKFCKRLESEGVDLITLHPRLVTEKFKGRARWDYIGRLKQELKIPVAGNGDIKTSEDIINRANGQCDAIMVGRAAVRQPWIFAATKGILFENSHAEAQSRRVAEEEKIPTPNSPLNLSDFASLREITGIRFLELLRKHQPVEFHLSRANRFFGFFCDNLKWGNFLKNQINREQSISGIEKVWCEYFRNNDE